FPRRGSSSSVISALRPCQNALKGRNAEVIVEKGRPGREARPGRPDGGSGAGSACVRSREAVRGALDGRVDVADPVGEQADGADRAGQRVVAVAAQRLGAQVAGLHLGPPLRLLRGERRSEERRVGKECRAERWAEYEDKD